MARFRVRHQVTVTDVSAAPIHVTKCASLVDGFINVTYANVCQFGRTGELIPATRFQTFGLDNLGFAGESVVVVTGWLRNTAPDRAP